MDNLLANFEGNSKHLTLTVKRVREDMNESIQKINETFDHSYWTSLKVRNYVDNLTDRES